MTEAARLSVVVEANIGSLERGLSRAQAQLVATQRAASKVDGSTTAMARSSKKGAGAMAGMATSAKMLAGPAAVGGLAMVMTSAVRKTAGFEKKMASTRAVAGASGRELAKLRKQAMDLGPAFGVGATEAAAAQTELAKGGLSTAAILSGAFKSAVSLAAAGEMGMADAATVTVNALKTFGIEGRNAQHVADALALAANKTTADVSDFGMALTQGGAQAKSAGYSFDQTLTVLGALAEIGVKGSDAGTSMKTAMSQLIAPTKRQAEAAKQAGLSFLTQNGEMKSATSLARALRTQTEGLTKAQRTALFTTLAGTDGVRTLNALYAAGPSRLSAMERAWQKQGYAVEVAQQKQQGLHGDLKRLSAEWESAQIEIGTAFAPGLTKGLQSITETVREMRNSGDLTQLGEDLGTSMSAIAKAAPIAAKGLSMFSTAYTAAVENFKPVSDLTEGFSSFENGARKITSAIKALQKIPGTPISDPFANRLNGAEEQLRRIQAMKNLQISVPVALLGEDNVIGGLRDIEAIRLRNKIQRVLGQNTDAKSKVEQIQAMNLPRKLQRILGQNGDAISKIAAVQSYVNSLRDRTVNITVKASLQGSMAALAAASRGGLKGEARGGGGRTRTALVGEGRRGEYVYDSVTGQTGWIDSPTLLDLGPNHWVIPTDPAYRSRAASLAGRAGLDMYAKGKKGKKKKRNRVEQTDPSQRPANTAGDRRLNPLLPGQNSFDQVEPPEVKAPQFTRAEVALAQARAMGDLGSIQQAAQGVLVEKTAAYNAAVASGDLDRMKEAADALKSAGDELREAGKQIVQSNLDRFDAQLIRAKITTPKDVSDDIAALQGALGVATQAWQGAEAAGDIQGQREFGSEVLSLTQSIEDLRKSVDNSEERARQQNELLKQQLDEARRLAASSAATSSALVKGLVDAANRQLGGVLGQSLSTPSSTGRVAALR